MRYWVMHASAQTARSPPHITSHVELNELGMLQRNRQQRRRTSHRMSTSTSWACGGPERQRRRQKSYRMINSTSWACSGPERQRHRQILYHMSNSTSYACTSAIGSDGTERHFVPPLQGCFTIRFHAQGGARSSLALGWLAAGLRPELNARLAAVRDRRNCANATGRRNRHQRNGSTQPPPTQRTDATIANTNGTDANAPTQPPPTLTHQRNGPTIPDIRHPCANGAQQASPGQRPGGNHNVRQRSPIGAGQRGCVMRYWVMSDACISANGSDTAGYRITC